MTEKVQRLLKDLQDKEYRNRRLTLERMSFENIDTQEGQLYWLDKILEIEKPLIYDDDDFGFNRYGG